MLKTGEKIIQKMSLINEIPKIISNLDDSYIYIQGPPGTGKTYQAANAITRTIKTK